jgi:hypothetical protein
MLKNTKYPIRKKSSGGALSGTFKNNPIHYNQFPKEVRYNKRLL